MSTESVSIIGITIICWGILIAADAAVSAIIYFIFGTSFRKVFVCGLISLAVPPSVIAYGVLIERNLYRVKKIELAFSELPESFDGYRIVQISDIHARSFSSRPGSLEKATRIIDGLDPDMIAFTGDLITISPEETDRIRFHLSQMNGRDGVFSILGNHDYGIYSNVSTDRSLLAKDLIEREKELGWNVLLNESKAISRGKDTIYVIGVENTSASEHFPSKGDLRKASMDTEGNFRILLTHDPTHWDMEVKGNGYPLTLSGHTHSMQFSLLGWSPCRYIFKQYRGLYSDGDEHLYINTGLGETIFPARIGVRPEITLITLRTVSLE